MSSLTKISAADAKLRSEKGAILFIVAAGMVVFIGMAGLAIDLGMLYNVKTDLQNATDAAALAGAWKLDGTGAGIKLLWRAPRLPLTTIGSTTIRSRWLQVTLLLVQFGIQGIRLRLL